MQSLKSLINEDVILYIFDTIDSTNDFLLKQQTNSKPQICLANTQLAGRGQYNRTWLDSKNSSILLSIRTNIANSIAGLSLVIGIAVIDALKTELAINSLKLKWPNDIYYNGQKLAGILIESKLQNNSNDCIIGLGLNINMAADFSSQNTWTDISKILNTKIINKDIITATIIKHILRAVANFEQKSLDFFLADWHLVDYLYNKDIKLATGIYKAIGISTNGALLLKSYFDNSTKEIYNSNDILQIYDGI